MILSNNCKPRILTTITSLELTEKFQNVHDKVLKIIRGYEGIIPKEIIELYFIKYYYIDKHGIKRPLYLITELGVDFIEIRRKRKDENVFFCSKYVEKFNTMVQECVDDSIIKELYLLRYQMVGKLCGKIITLYPITLVSYFLDVSVNISKEILSNKKNQKILTKHGAPLDKYFLIISDTFKEGAIKKYIDKYNNEYALTKLGVIWLYEMIYKDKYGEHKRQKFISNIDDFLSSISSLTFIKQNIISSLDLCENMSMTHYALLKIINNYLSKFKTLGIDSNKYFIKSSEFSKCGYNVKVNTYNITSLGLDFLCNRLNRNESYDFSLKYVDLYSRLRNKILVMV